MSLMQLMDTKVNISVLCVHKVFMDRQITQHRDIYSKEPKSVTAFDLFTFFRTDLIQPEASWKLSSTSDRFMSARKNLNEVILLGSLL